METAAHPRFLFKPRTFGMMFVTLTSSASLRTGVVKTFRWATQVSQMETALDAATQHLFTSVVGRTLTGLSRDQYSFNGEPSAEDAGSLQLDFGTTLVTLKLRSDGESVTADTTAIELTPAFSLDDDSHCSWEIVDMLDSEPWSQLRGLTLRSVDAVVDVWQKHDSRYVSGWFLTFDGHHLCYMNWGDNARIMIDEPFPMADHDEVQTSRLSIAHV